MHLFIVVIICIVIELFSNIVVYINVSFFGGRPGVFNIAKGLVTWL